MKKLFLVIFSALLIFSTSEAQSGKMGWIAKFGMAGGVTPTWIVPDMDALNAYMPGFGLDKLPENGFFAMGGSGYAYIMVVKNLRVGGMGFSGNTSVEGLVNGYRQQVDYQLGAGAFTVEYTLPFIRKMAVSVGAMIGGGSVQIDIYKNKGNFSFNNLFTDLNSPSENISRRLSSNFFTVSPTLNIDIPFARFIAFRIGGGYLMTFGDDWKIENDQTLHNVPSELNGDSFFIQTGLFFGFFAF